MTKPHQRLRDRAKNVKVSLSAAAPILGVRRQHLSYVLNGHRESKRLIQAFTELVEEAEQRAQTHSRRPVA